MSSFKPQETPAYQKAFEAARNQMAQPSLPTDFTNVALSQLRRMLAEDPSRADEVHQAAMALLQQQSNQD